MMHLSVAIVRSSGPPTGGWMPRLSNARYRKGPMHHWGRVRPVVETSAGQVARALRSTVTRFACAGSRGLLQLPDQMQTRGNGCTAPRQSIDAGIEGKLRVRYHFVVSTRMSRLLRSPLGGQETNVPGYCSEGPIYDGRSAEGQESSKLHQRLFPIDFLRQLSPTTRL